METVLVARDLCDWMLWIRLKALLTRVGERRASGTHSLKLQVMLQLQLMRISQRSRGAEQTDSLHVLAHFMAISFTMVMQGRLRMGRTGMLQATSITSMWKIST